MVNAGGVVRSQLRDAFASAPTVNEAVSLVVDPGQRDLAPAASLVSSDAISRMSKPTSSPWKVRAFP